MISKILKCQNVGLLQDATQAGPVSLGQVTAIYADNGRGKSTLAAVLRACQLGDAGRLNARKTIDGPGSPEVKLLLPTGRHVEFTANAWTSALPDIVVFDSEFVAQNVYSGFEVRADQRQSLLEFALGNQTVQLKQQIDAFQRRIEAAKNAQTLAARKDPTNILGIQFDAVAFFKVMKTQIQDVEEAAEAVVKAHLAKHNFRDFEDWASRGQQFVSGSDCPFCGQSVGGIGLIEAYRSFFNKAYAELKRQVAALESQVVAGLAESKIEAAMAAAATNTARIEAWNDQVNVTAPALDGVALAAALKQVRERLLALVLAKQRTPLESVGSQADVDAIDTALADIAQAVTAYNAAVQGVALQIEDFRKKLGTDNTTFLAAEIRKLEAAQKRVLPDVMTAVTEYQAAETERKRLDGEKTTARQNLDALMQATLQQ